ncbi:type VII secretion protein EccE, partial [Actinoplanes sp. NPDC051851]|uniref:type VII secretion protein EccE n=1 Tax=Actinoplanes sp. NPDC051851 TaxID=3154753 RepID=UPI0034170AAB
MQPDTSLPRQPLRAPSASRPDGVWSAGRVPGRFGRVQLIAIEVALVAATAAAFGRNAVAILVTALVGVLLLVFTVVPSGGRWLYQSIAARRRLRHRRGQARTVLRATGDPVAAAVPGLQIRTATDRGVSFGVGQDQTGWFAVLGVMSWIGPTFERPPSVGLDRLGRLLAETVPTVSALQIVTHHQSAVPETGTAANDLVWLAMRLGSWDAADAAASRGGGVEGVDRALAAAVGRITTMLNGAEVPCDVLDANELLHALTVSSGLYRPGGRAPAELDESWRQWSAGGLTHVVFAVRGWPSDPDPDLVEHLAAVPAVAVDSAVLVAPNGADEVAYRVLIRVSSTPQFIADSLRNLRENAKRSGVRLVRVDGDHGTGVYGTAPTGWTPAGPMPNAWAATAPAPRGWAPRLAAPRA